MEFEPDAVNSRLVGQSRDDLVAEVGQEPSKRSVRSSHPQPAVTSQPVMTW